MKRSFAKTFNGRSITLWWTPLFFVAATRLANAASLQEARVSQVIQDVRLLEAHGAPRPAVVNDKVTLERAVRTGVESRAELTFTDLTITRLGANTIFSLKAGAREVDLTSGTILLAVPSGRAPVKANTTSVTVAVMGGTALLATGPPTKFMVLEGIGTFYPKGHPEKAVTVHGGEMVMMTADKKITQPEKLNVRLVLETSALIVDFPPLTNLPLILAVVNQQLAEQQLAGATSQPLARNLVDVIDVTSQNANANPVVLVSTSTSSPTPPPPTPTPPPPTPTPPPPTPTPPTPTPSPPTPTPSKFGTPTTITSPVPYLITSGTVITTDPSITTNGVTDYGKIYRGQTDDGAFSVWAFGSTSAVDTALDFDTHFNNAGHFPAAVFKFTSLELVGNPTIDLTNGGVTNLGLISVGDITSGLPGGTLTFTGLDALLLASQDGSINLGSEITFQDIPTLFFYARGANGDLTLASPILGTTDLFLYAGRNITFNAGTDLILGGQFSARTASGNISVSESGDITVGGSLSATVNNNGGQIGTGGNISFTTGGDLTTGSGSAFTIQNTTGTIDNGGNITLNVDGSTSTQGQLSLLVENYDESGNPAGHIGTGGNISLTTGGNLTADSISVAINNRAGGVIDSGVSLTFNISGALTTLHDGTDYFGFPSSLSLYISNRYANNTAGSFIGGNATLELHADSASIGGNLNALISDRGGTIDGNALLNFSVTNNVTVQGDAAWQILNDSGPDLNAASPIGGTIHGNANLLLSATNLTVTTGELDVQIFNKNGGVPGSGGTIDSDANIAFNLTGNLTTQTSASFDILNQLQSGGTTGGTIGGDATVNVTAANISTGVNSFGTSLDSLINNATGNIGGDAIVNVDVGDLINAQGPATFQILNNDGGHIGGDANIFVTTGGDLTANSILAFVNNHNLGTIESGANITFDIGGALTTTGDATFVISNLNEGPGGGTIGSLATFDLNAASVSVGGFFQTFVGANGGGSITGSASNLVNATGNLVVQGPIAVQIEDTGFIQIDPIIFIAGGHIGGNATVTLSAQNITTFSTASGIPGIDTMALEASIYSNGSGTIGGDAIVNVLASQNISAPGTVFFTVANGNYMGFGGGTIGGDAQLNISAVNFMAGTLFADIYNYDGASIGGNANINLSLTGDLTTQGDALFRILNFGGGNIVGDAAINVNAANITANSLVADIDNSGGGTIGGSATIYMNVSGNATVTNDATVAIYGSDGAGSAAININGGNYNVGGTFLTYIDGDGTITFNNATAHADVLKVGALGANGVLNIGGGILSADTTLKLYASGSNGQLNFVSNVTLDSGLGSTILAANSVTIFDNVVVTIGGKAPADVYTNNANYSGFGGNGTTTGTFAGAGANNPQPLANAPPFGPSSPAPPTGTHGGGTSGRRTGGTVDVNSSAELLAMLDGAAVGPDGRIAISDSKRTGNWRDLSRMDANRLLRAERRMVMHERGIMRVGGGKLAAAQ
jgi:hypothetical protein